MPFLFRRAFFPQEPARLGGSTFSLLTVNLGGVFLRASIFASAYAEVLHGAAYTLWTLSIIPIVVEVWGIVRDGLARLETSGAAPKQT